MLRSSRSEVFCKKGALKIFYKIHRKTPMTKFLLIKLQLEVCNFMKTETLGPAFFCEFCEIFKNTYFIKHLWVTAFVCFMILFS